MQASTAANADAREYLLVWNLLSEDWSVVCQEDEEVEYAFEVRDRKGEKGTTIRAFSPTLLEIGTEHEDLALSLAQ